MSEQSSEGSTPVPNLFDPEGLTREDRDTLESVEKAICSIPAPLKSLKCWNCGCETSWLLRDNVDENLGQTPVFCVPVPCAYNWMTRNSASKPNGPELRALTYETQPAKVIKSEGSKAMARTRKPPPSKESEPGTSSTSALNNKAIKSGTSGEKVNNMSKANPPRRSGVQNAKVGSAKDSENIKTKTKVNMSRKRDMSPENGGSHNSRSQPAVKKLKKQEGHTTSDLRTDSEPARSISPASTVALKDYQKKKCEPSLDSSLSLDSSTDSESDSYTSIELPEIQVRRSIRYRRPFVRNNYTAIISGTEASGYKPDDHDDSQPSGSFCSDESSEHRGKRKKGPSGRAKSSASRNSTRKKPLAKTKAIAPRKLSSRGTRVEKTLHSVSGHQRSFHEYDTVEADSPSGVPKKRQISSSKTSSQADKNGTQHGSRRSRNARKKLDAAEKQGDKELAGGRNRNGSEERATTSRNPTPRIKPIPLRPYLHNLSHLPPWRATRPPQKKQDIIDKVFTEPSLPKSNAPKDLLVPSFLTNDEGRAVHDVFTDATTIFLKVIEKCKTVFALRPSKQQAWEFLGRQFLECVSSIIHENKFVRMEEYQVVALSQMKMKFGDKWDKPGVMFLRDDGEIDAEKVFESQTRTEMEEDVNPGSKNTQIDPSNTKSKPLTLKFIEEAEGRYLSPEFFRSLPMPSSDLMTKNRVTQVHLKDKNFNIDDYKVKYFCGLHPELSENLRLDLYVHGFTTYDGLKRHFQSEHAILPSSLHCCPVVLRRGVCTHKAQRPADIRRHVVRSHRSSSFLIQRLESGESDTGIPCEVCEPPSQQRETVESVIVANTDEEKITGTNDKRKPAIKKNKSQAKAKAKPKSAEATDLSGTTRPDPICIPELCWKEEEVSLSFVIRQFISGFRKRKTVPPIFEGTVENGPWPFTGDNFIERINDMLPDGELKAHYLKLEQEMNPNRSSYTMQRSLLEEIAMDEEEIAAASGAKIA